VKNIRFLSLKSGKAKIGMKENVLEMFYERKGWNEKKEDWRKNFEKEIDLKEIELKELILKKKLAKSKKRKFEIFKECKGMLYTLVKNWEETPRMEEERMFAKLKESVQKERMEIDLNKKKEDTPGNEIALEDDDTNVKIESVVVDEEYDSYVWKTKKKTQKTFTHTNDDCANQVALCTTPKTTEGLPVRQFAQKKALDATPARVSGQLANIFITKPQQVYASVGIGDQNRD
jgi:hypothetical protein